MASRSTVRTYLLPIDVKFNGVGDLTSEMTNVSTILAGLDDGIRANIVFLDACRDNPIAQKVVRSTDASRAVSGAYRPCLAIKSGQRRNHGGGHSASLRHGPGPGRS